MSGGRSVYRLRDEPQPGVLAKLAVEPLWPLLALMLAGAWLGFPWLALNAVAVGSPTKKREFLLVTTAVLGSLALGLGLLHGLKAGYIPSENVLPYALLVLVVWKLSLGYALFSLQSETIELYRYYGGVLSRFGLPVMLVGAFVLRPVVLGLLSSPLWYLVVS
ncbi:MAG: hypothetical protein ABWY06_10375 [Pseudomonas sp.]|uniref:hypothetical protein n=1 Tax=Pseudomonas sp. TaxID=306 RepID=UPI0033971A46